MEDEDFLALSDERDMWEKRLLDAEKTAYRQGFNNGWDKGRTDFYKAREEDWELFKFFDLEPMLRRPDYTEMEKRRYGPGGKLMAGEPRDGDYTGGPVEWL